MSGTNQKSIDVCRCPAQHAAPPHPLRLNRRLNRYDPTGTGLERRAFAANLKARFARLKRAVRAAVVERDCFGLAPTPHTLAAQDATGLPAPRAFQFETSPNKIKGFMSWLDEAERREGLETTKGGAVGTLGKQKLWADTYIRSSYQKGMRQAWNNMERKGVVKARKEEAKKWQMDAAFATPVHADRAALLYTRVYSELEGVTAEMDKRMSRTLAQGIVDGRNPREIAAQLVDQDIYDATWKALRVAQTEVIRAHFQASLETYRQAGVEGVEVQAELLASADACRKCQDLEAETHDKPLAIDDPELQELIPVHPNCVLDGQVPIFTSRGWKPIKAVKVGDLVLTHRGRFQRVTQVHRTHAPAGTECVQFRVKSGAGNWRKLSLTANHPVLVGRRWVEAAAVKAGSVLHILASTCRGCGKSIPWANTFCSQTCSSRATATAQWKTEAMREAVTRKNRANMLEQYQTGKRDRFQITQGAHEGMRKRLAAGTFALQTWDRSGGKNPSKRPEVQAKISASKMGDLNAMKRPEVRARVSASLRALFAAHPEQHINARLAQKARVKGGAMTWIEESMSMALAKVGLAPQYNHSVGSLWVDFGFPDQRLAVECDGERWHSDPVKEASRDARLKAAGWSVLHFTGKQIHANADACAKEVRSVFLNHEHEYIFKPMRVEAVKQWRLLKARRVWNLTVAEDESYLAHGWVVHNCRCCILPVVSAED